MRADPLGQSAYSTGTYASSGSYDAAPTSYLPAATGAAVAGNGWFEPADGTGTGGFPAVPPAPVMGRQAPPVPAGTEEALQAARTRAPAAAATGGATQQAALPPANRPRESGADWEPRAAAPRRPAAGSTGSSHQPRPQQPQPAAPRRSPAPTASRRAPVPSSPATATAARPSRTQDLGRSSDRNGAAAAPPCRRDPAAAGDDGPASREPAAAAF